MVKGSCLCRTVTWEIEALQMLSHCHCSRCRKAAGGAFASFTFGPVSGFRFTAGEGKITDFRVGEGARSFCSRCGSVTPGTFGDVAYMSAGCLDDDPLCRPESHIFVGSKAPWYEIPDDGAARFDEYPPGFEAPAVASPPGPPPKSHDDCVRGSCLCGGVAFETGRPLAWVNCHCSRCRKARSAAFGANLFAAAEGFQFTRGGELVRTYKVPEAERFTVAFCERCGSSLPRGKSGQANVGVPGGALDDEVGELRSIHIFVASKAPWFEIPDGTEHYDEYPPGFDDSHVWVATSR